MKFNPKKAFMVMAPPTLIVVAGVLGDVTILEKAQDVAGTIPIATYATSATAAPVITYHVADVDNIRKHYPKVVYSPKKATWDIY